MKQHFLPKCYLNEFCVNGNLYVIEATQGSQHYIPFARAKTPTQVCYVNDFYTLDNDILDEHLVSLKIDEYFIERDIFGRHESLYPDLLNKIKDQQSLPYHEAFAFLKFLVSLKLRNKFIFDIFSGENHDKIVKELIGDLKEKYLHGENHRFTHLSIIEREKAFETLAITVLNNPQHQKKTHLIGLIDRETSEKSVLNDVVNKLMLYKWNLVETSIENPFITSDNPGYCIDRSGRIHNTKFIEGGFIFPLSPTLCLYIHEMLPDDYFWEDISVKFIRKEPALAEFVASANLGTKAFVNNILISDRPETLNYGINKMK